MIIGFAALISFTALRFAKRTNALVDCKGSHMPIQKLFTSNTNGIRTSLYVRKDDENISACDIFQKKETALLGISLGNSFFTKERMHLIFTAFATSFKNVAVLLADDLAVHNYRAMGYDERKTRRKVHKNSNKTRNKIKATIQDVASDNIDFYQWHDIEAYDGYRQAIEKVTDIYHSDPTFSKEIKQIVLQHIPHTDNQNDVLNEAKWYFLKELAFICASSNFFKSSVVSGYHQSSPLFHRNLLAELQNISFVIYECRNEPEPI